MELKTPDLISAAQGKVTSARRRRYQSVWFSFFLFLYLLNKNTERCMNLTPSSRETTSINHSSQRYVGLIKEYI